jgi:hypothetical protein
MKKSITTPQIDRPVLQPAVLSFYEERRAVEEIARRVDKRPLGELVAQVEDAFKQILVRAHAGDDDALGWYFYIARQTVLSFDNLVRHELDRTRAVAELGSDLPVLLSLNPQDIKAAKERVRLLNVGAKAILQTRPGQRTDQRNLWTRLAIYAFNACLENSRCVPGIETHYAGAKQRRVKRKLWGTIEKGTEYKLPDGSWVVIADWHKECVKLAGQITADNFNQWRSVIKICVLEFWNRSKDNYNKALNEVGNLNNTVPKYRVESYRRHLAMNRTLQAFKNQFLHR